MLTWKALLADQRQKFLSKALANLATIKSCMDSMTGTNSFMTMTINRCLDYTKVFLAAWRPLFASHIEKLSHVLRDKGEHRF